MIHRNGMSLGNWKHRKFATEECRLRMMSAYAHKRGYRPPELRVIEPHPTDDKCRWHPALTRFIYGRVAG